jgi:hypothetical protein
MIELLRELKSREELRCDFNEPKILFLKLLSQLSLRATI